MSKGQKTREHGGPALCKETTQGHMQRRQVTSVILGRVLNAIILTQFKGMKCL